MVSGPEEHLIRGQRVAFNWRRERLFPVMQLRACTRTHTHSEPLCLGQRPIRSDIPASLLETTTEEEFNLPHF